VQEKYSALQQRTAKQSGANGESEELRQRISELETELKTSQSKDRDFGESLSHARIFASGGYRRKADTGLQTT